MPNTQGSTSISIIIPPGKMLFVVISRSLCECHMKAKPFGSVAGGGPVTLPDANIVANGPWYSGSPYLGPDANLRSMGSTPIPPFGTIANSPSTEAGFAFMWHSHNEREITTNNIFPGGMMMMMLVDPWVFKIIEAN